MTQDTKGNIAVLVKSIIEKDPGMIRVKDSAMISYYVNKSKYMFEIEPKDKAKLNLYKCMCSTIEKEFNKAKGHHLKFAGNLGANYIFVSNFYEHGNLLSVMHPFMVISEAESDFLIRHYYKDVPEKVSKAAKNLGITLFDEAHPRYLRIDHTKSLPGFSSAFLNFIFALPYEEQNIEANKRIMQSNSNIDSISILTREYAQGKYFQDYFDSIPNNSKKRLVSEINLLERNPDHDIFLLKKGFVVSELDPVAIYREDTKSFISYFEKLGLEAKKFVIEKIYSESFVNQKAVDWLNKNYAPLLREVGFLGEN